jgi:ADP-ribosylglycohydrolase
MILRQDDDAEGVFSVPSLRRRIRGCLLGGAIGDALGAPVEFLTRNAILSRYGPEGIERFSTAYGRLGAITDDTQLTLFTAEGLLRARAQFLKGVTPNPVARVYAAYQRWMQTQGERDPDTRNEHPGWLVGMPELHHHRSPGATCITALRERRFGTLAEPLNQSKGCGGIMRVAPAGLFRGFSPFKSFVLGCELAAITHGAPSGYLAAGAFSMILRLLLDGSELPSAVEQVIARLRQYEPAGNQECTLALEAALFAWRRGADSAHTDDEYAHAVEMLGGGWTAEQALSIGVFAALVHSKSFSKCVHLAVNHGGDSDTTGSIAGNLVGAMLGDEAFAPEWVGQLELADVIAQIADDIVDSEEGRGPWLVRYPV